MAVALGIDTGGTYTDAVLVDQAGGTTIAGAKALTTYHDLSIGIGEAVAAVFDGRGVKPAEVSLVGLSTTLATNAIVEGRGSPVCLLLVGYDPALIRQYGFEHDLVTQDVAYLPGGHDGAGNEVQPLDEREAREAILAHCGRVEAFAISGYFGVRNPAHELRVRALVEELTASTNGGQPLPVTCGHELTSRLNAVRRATTVALNARLIPLLRELIGTVRHTLGELGIAAPLMVVKGDGSLVRAEWAIRRPIETILSGPAASVVGAWHLAGRRDAWMVDVGGTTTDIVALRNGRVRVNPEGAQVGRWRTMVEAVDAHTVGLGGDSLVVLDGDRRLAIGPRRVVPLCLVAEEYPGIVDELRRQAGLRQREGLVAQFALVQRQVLHELPEAERALLQHLSAGPQPLATLVERLRYSSLALRQIESLEARRWIVSSLISPACANLNRIESLEARRWIVRAGFTPTDALHALGRFERWNAEASRLGAQLLAKQAGLSPEAFCERVVADVSNRVSTALVSKVLSDAGLAPDWEHEPAAAALLARALDDGATSPTVPGTGSDLDCRLALRHPLVAVGAPVEAYMPRVARQLSTELVIPPHAEVANAVGAVAGSVVQQVQVIIRPLDNGERFRLHLPDGVRDLRTVEEGVAYAERVLPEWLRALARQAGADQVELSMSRVDQSAPVQATWGQPVYLGTHLTFTAVGRPGSRPDSS